jgi:hypothetical protein
MKTKKSRHATVRVGDYEIPLIGVPRSATDGMCEGCYKTFHITELGLTEDNRTLCAQCAKKQCKDLEGSDLTKKEP